MSLYEFQNLCKIVNERNGLVAYLRAEDEEDCDGRGELSPQEAQQVLDIRPGTGEYEETANNVVRYISPTSSQSRAHTWY